MEINVEYLCENTDLLQHLEIDLIDFNTEEFEAYLKLQDKLRIVPNEYARHTNITV